MGNYAGSFVRILGISWLWLLFVCHVPARISHCWCESLGIYPPLTTSRVWPWSWYLVLRGHYLQVTRIVVHFLEWKDIRQSDSNFSSAERSSCSLFESCKLSIWRNSKQSSANNLAWESTTEERSLIKARNKRRPRTVPWGTPEVTSASSDLAPSIRTCCFLLRRKLSIQERVLPRTA